MAAKTEAVPATETMVDVFVPKVSGEAPFQYVAVNGKAWQIPRGKKVQVPAYVKDVLDRAQQAQEAADKYSDEEQKKMAAIQGVPV